MPKLTFKRLRKELGLFDVYVISTGAMISSGFFLLPGIAADMAGPAVVLAYLLAGVLIVPALASQAELAAAMPRAGGTYFFLDRTLGPLVGTIGGVGTWLTLVLKSGFALIGMGAYLALVIDVPIRSIALVFTVVVAIVNIAGAKESSSLLRFLVVSLLTVLAFFLLDGLVDTARQGMDLRARFTPLLTGGFDGVLATVGLVFISYVGLTKVASLAEEVKDPDRNIPLGMGLALVTVTTVYVVGVFIMVAVLGIDDLRNSLTPVADTAARFSIWLPPSVVVWLMVGAAIVAFAAMANAGIMAASRYPLAMARDRLFPQRFSKTSQRGAPVSSILFTCGLLAFCIMTLDVRHVAELAGALQLLLFGLINVAVIVMRESHIESYDPGYRAPFYPWLQLLGVFVTLVLVAEMGWVPALFTIGVTAGCFAWYTYYARDRIARDGAIFHVFERLGRRRFAGLDTELRDIMKEKGARIEDPFDEVVARAFVIDTPRSSSLREMVGQATELLALRLPVTTQELQDKFDAVLHAGAVPMANGAALIHARIAHFDGAELVLGRCKSGVRLDEDMPLPFLDDPQHPIVALFFLVSDETAPGRHLRILAQLAGRIEDDGFMEQWLACRHEPELKETLLRDDRFFSLRVRSGTPAGELIDRQIRDVSLPPDSLIALIRRRGEQIIPHGDTMIEDGDRLTVIGDADDIRELERRYGGPANTKRG